jgi:multidrug resistance protein
VLLVLYITAFVDMVGLTMIVPLLPYYAADFGASATVVGVLISAFSIAQLLVAPGWGRLSDRVGRRPAILLGLLVTAVAYVGFGLAASVAALFAVRLVQGIGGGTIGVVQAYVADAVAPHERTHTLGWLSAVTSLGAVAGPALGSLLLDVGGRRAPGFVSAALATLVAAFAWRYLKESRDLRHSGTYAVPPSSSSRSAILGVLTRWSEPAPRLIWIYTIAIGAFYGTIQTVPLLLSHRLNVTERSVGYFIMFLGGMGVIVRTLVLRPAVTRFGEARLSRAGLAVLGLGLAATGLAHGYPLLAVGFVLMPVGTAFLFPSITGMLSAVVPGNDRGLYMGVQHTFGGVSRVVFPVASGVLMDRFGVGVPFWISGLLVLATLALTRTLSTTEVARRRGGA